MKKILLFLGIASLLVSCGPVIQSVKGTVKFNEVENEIFTKKELKDYIRKTNAPTIVLRVPNITYSYINTEDNITNKNDFSDSDVYGTIEKELAKAGFIVRDRSLFNKLSNDNKVQDYSKLRELTNTELILEVVRVRKIPYDTNEYVNSNGKEKIAPFNIKMYGEKIEFRIISVKSNDMVGNYVFNYTPCIEGCTYIYDELGNIKNINSDTKSAYKFVGYGTVLEKFYKVSTERLISELKK